MYEQISLNKRKSILLIVLFIFIITVLVWAVEHINGSGVEFTLFAFGISILMAVGSFFAADKIALSVAGARGPISKNDNPYVYRIVENLAITSGIPIPNIYIINDNSLNAFATGRDPRHASIALTAGIIQHLENEELEGVVAHELAHIKNYDIRFMTLVVVLVGTVVLLADYMFRWGFIFRGRGENRNTHPWLLMVGLLLLILSPIIAELIKLSVSRKREFLADASGALLTRYPEGLARALEKIALNSTLKRSSSSTAHLYIASPFGGAASKRIARLFSTHPPIEERIRALRAL